MANTRWYVAATSVHLESYAAVNLRRQGFRSFVPCRKKIVRHGRKVTTKHAAYFPGYIFTSLDLDCDRWRSVNGTFGVKSLLMNGERPVPAPSGFVEALLEASDGSGIVDLSSSLVPGARVRPIEGPLADFVGILDRADGEGRVRVLFEVMNGRIPVLMDRANLMEAA